jgi:hypothetical protein
MEQTRSVRLEPLPVRLKQALLRLLSQAAQWKPIPRYMLLSQKRFQGLPQLPRVPQQTHPLLTSL